MEFVVELLVTKAGKYDQWAAKLEQEANRRDSETDTMRNEASQYQRYAAECREALARLALAGPQKKGPANPGRNLRGGEE